jgi:hypothetical protein
MDDIVTDRRSNLGFQKKGCREIADRRKQNCGSRREDSR